MTLCVTHGIFSENNSSCNFFAECVKIFSGGLVFSSRTRLSLILFLSIVFTVAMLWIGTHIMLEQAYKNNFLETLEFSVRLSSTWAPLPPPGKALGRRIDNSVVYLISLEKGWETFYKVAESLHIPQQDVMEFLKKGSGAMCVDPQCKEIVAGTRYHELLSQKDAILLVIVPAKILKKLFTIEAGIWMFVSLITAVIAFFIGYLMLYFGYLKSISGLFLEINKIPRLLKGKVTFKGIGREQELLSRLLSEFEELDTKAQRLDVQIRRIRENLMRSQESLIRSEKLASVGILAAGLAHEIGNPIGIIMGLAELIAQEDLPQDEVKEYAEAILKSTKRIDRIIKDLLVFARPTSNEPPHTQVCEMIKDTLQLMKPQKDFKGIEVELDLKNCPVYAEIRPSHLQQVLVNLLLNAAQAMQGRGRVKLSMFTDEKQVFIRIEDNGPGIDKALLKKIWEPFFTTKKPGKGTGLGLPMSLRIINAYGGDITVETTPGRGSVFTLVLWEVK